MNSIAPGKITLIPEKWLFHCTLDELWKEMGEIQVAMDRAEKEHDGQNLFNTRCALMIYDFAYGVVLRATSRN